jgi:hypothetical protein
VVLTLRWYALADHVLDDLVTPLSPLWYQMDSVVLFLLNDIITVEVQDIICDQANTARQAWLALEGQFLGNREARALHLDVQFHQFSQGDLSVGEYCCQMKGMADSLRDLGEPIVDRTLVLNLLHGIIPRYGHLKALIKRIALFPTFQAVRNELLLEELTMESEAPAPASALYSAPLGGQAPSRGQTPRSPSTVVATHTTRRPYGPSSGFQRRRRSSFPQGWPREQRLHSGWRPGVTIILQPLDRNHRHVAGPGPERLPSYANPPNSASLRRASDDSTSDPAPASRDTHPDTLVPTSWRVGPILPRCRLQHHGNDTPLQLGGRLRCVLTTPRARYPATPHYSHPSSVVVGNDSTLPVTSVGASILPRPFYLNNVLVAPHITHNLLSVRRFTTSNSCYIEFDHFGFSMKDLPTKTPLTRCDSSGPLYTLWPSSTGASSPPALVSTTSSTTWHRRLDHPGPDVITKLTSSLDILCSRGHFEGLCHACQLGQHISLTFTTSRAEQTFELIHCDIWTSPILSLSGYKYYLVILDDFSHFLWTFPLRLKSDTFATLTHFFTWVSTQFHRPVCALQCDNNHKFDNNSSCSFFLTHGVHLSLVLLHLFPERSGRTHHSHHHQHDPLPPLSSISPCQLLGRGPEHRYTSQPPPLEGGEPSHSPLRPVWHNPLLRPPSRVQLCLLSQHFRHRSP